MFFLPMLVLACNTHNDSPTADIEIEISSTEVCVGQTTALNVEGKDSKYADVWLEGGAVLSEQTEIDRNDEYMWLITCTEPGTVVVWVDGGGLAAERREIECKDCETETVCEDLGHLTAAAATCIGEPSGEEECGSDPAYKALAARWTDINLLIFTVAAQTAINLVSCMDPSVWCAPGATDPTQRADPSWLLAGMQFAEPVPAADNTESFQYAWVFETNEDATDDWTGIPAYPNDFFIGTDRWYELTYEPGGAWELSVSEIGTDQSITGIPSQARATPLESGLVLLVPLDEVGPDPALRWTAFRHDGAWLQGNWNADYYPHVGTLEAVHPTKR